MEDNWRLRDKSQVGFGNNQDIAQINDNIDVLEKMELSYYLGKIPSEKVKIDSIVNERNTAYFKLGIIYKEQFNELDLAKDKFEKQFSQIIKLIEHGAKVHQQNHLNHSKNIRVVGNSHVDVFGYFLNEYFQGRNWR